MALAGGAGNAKHVVTQHTESASFDCQAHFEVSKEARPVIMPTRRVPLAMQDRFDSELSRQENMGVITKQIISMGFEHEGHRKEILVAACVYRSIIPQQGASATSLSNDRL